MKQERPVNLSGAGVERDVALCVDLDGTLVKSDTLIDSVIVLARQRPMTLLQFPGWVSHGKASFKQKVAQTVVLDAAYLPYNRELLEYLRKQHAGGRAIYLATGADAQLALGVATHLGIFAGILASDGSVNLTGRNKLAAFQARFGDGFCYIGNAKPDVVLLTNCVTPMVANPHASLMAGLRAAGVVPVHTFMDSTSGVTSWLKAIRLHQWAKNMLIFLPLLLAHVRSVGPIVTALLAFLSFGLAASATYLVNDLLDLEADRHHARKRRRPFAAGDLSPVVGVATIGLFLLASLAIALLLPRAMAALSPALAFPWKFLRWLAIYTVSTTVYSFWLKRMVLVDVIVLSGLYTIRILAGSAATGVPVSTWLAAFSIFFFLSLAFVKRFAELESVQERAGAGAAVAAAVKGRGYRIADLEQLRSFGTAAGYASVVVFALYIGNLDAVTLYRHTSRLWLLVPVLLLWLSRLWLLASRGDLHEDPVVYAITDRNSLLLGVVVVAIVLSAL